MHNIQFRLLPSAAFSLFSPPLSLSLSRSLSRSLFHAMLPIWIRRHNRTGLSGILRKIQTFFKVIFFNQRLLKDFYLDLIRASLRSFPLVLIFLLSADLSIPIRSIFLCLESNKVSDFRWRIQLISLGMRRVPANASRRNFHGCVLKRYIMPGIFRRN
jgi:hypothetical protein